MRGSWSLHLRGEDKKSLSTEEKTRGSGAYPFGARTTPNSLIEEKARLRDGGFLESTPSGRGQHYPLRKRRDVLGLHLQDEDKTNSLIEEKACSRVKVNTVI
jgi:hypothetical protein